MRIGIIIRKFGSIRVGTMLVYQQLEHSLNSGKLNQKIADDTSRNIKTLKSLTVPLIRKRQLMKTVFGDYRLKMKEEEKKLGLASRQVKFMGSNTNTQPKYNFVKKAAILTSGKEFRFNFQQKVEEHNGEIKVDHDHGENTDIKKLNLASGGEEFKFNFTIEGEEDINLNSLSIKS